MSKRNMKPCPECKRSNEAKKYVGGTGSYWYCSNCCVNYGGEEGPAKDAFIKAAAEQDPGEQGEVEGRTEAPPRYAHLGEDESASLLVTPTRTWNHTNQGMPDVGALVWLWWRGQAVIGMLQEYRHLDAVVVRGNVELRWHLQWPSSNWAYVEEVTRWKGFERPDAPL